jgi:hypothetical protein
MPAIAPGETPAAVYNNGLRAIQQNNRGPPNGQPPPGYVPPAIVERRPPPGVV